MQRSLDKQIDLPTAFWGDPLSAVTIERMLAGDAGLSRKRRAEAVDKMATAHRSRGVLDRVKAR
ncbi:MAG: hypothetical protein MI806_25815 [Minwuiales bacterium]|nr:hypothetical protein [Minwuiales bacterium]